MAGDFAGVLFAVAVIFSQFIFTTSLQCKTESGQNVDWFVAFKIPKEEAQKSPDAGRLYVYLSSDSKTSDWTVGKYQVQDEKSLFGRTLAPLYSSSSSSNFFAYSDQPPEGRGSSSKGHSKGVVHFDNNSGFWLMHSVPRYPNNPADTNKYDFPSSGVVNGQAFFCISFDPANSLNDILKTLLYIRPNIYGSDISASALSKYPDLQRLLNSMWVSGGVTKSNVKTTTGTNVIVFGKSPQANVDLYSGVIAPQLKSNLLVETWRKGSGGLLPSSCNSTFMVQNVDHVDVNADDIPKMWDEWSYTEDHSKWAVGVDQTEPFICVGDLNRVRSQFKRGGGAICMRNVRVWNVLRKSVKDVEPCPRKGKASRKKKGLFGRTIDYFRDFFP